MMISYDDDYVDVVADDDDDEKLNLKNYRKCMKQKR